MSFWKSILGDPGIPKEANSWFTTTWQGGNFGGQNNRIFSRRFNLKKEFSFLRREMLLFLTTNTTAALTSWSVSGHGVQTSNTVNCLLRPPLGTVLSKGCKERGVSWCCGNYCWLAFVLWCGYCSVSFQSFVLRHWCPQHQETTKERQGPTLGVSFTEVSVL